MGKLIELRRSYHRQLCRELVGCRSGTNYLSIADKHNRTSVEFAQGVVDLLACDLAASPPLGQTVGNRFAAITANFLEQAFRLFQHLRPGAWQYSTSQGAAGIAAYDQYEHLANVQRVLKEHRELQAALGGDYLVTPDIVVGRRNVEDSEINSHGTVIGRRDTCAKLSPLRRKNARTDYLLHASISCKWTMRSDRAQNTRTEALNLVRNRKGSTPHICAVTFECDPKILASLALGTGDLDCLYHVALPELQQTAQNSTREDAAAMLQILVDGRRLRDIADLPLDLAV